MSIFSEIDIKKSAEADIVRDWLNVGFTINSKDIDIEVVDCDDLTVNLYKRPQLMEGLCGVFLRDDIPFKINKSTVPIKVTWDDFFDWTTPNINSWLAVVLPADRIDDFLISGYKANRKIETDIIDFRIINNFLGKSNEYFKKQLTKRILLNSNIEVKRHVYLYV